MNTSVLEFRIIDSSLEKPLAKFFRALKREGDDKYFHPHLLTEKEAERRAQYSGKDLYYVLLEGDKVLGYGMLREWDEGYTVPSLGVAIHPLARGTGLGKLFVHFLHAVARRRGISKIRIKVYPQNTAAVTFYKQLGYVFGGEEAGQIVGYIRL